MAEALIFVVTGAMVFGTGILAFRFLWMWKDPRAKALFWYFALSCVGALWLSVGDIGEYFMRWPVLSERPIRPMVYRLIRDVAIWLLVISTSARRK